MKTRKNLFDILNEITPKPDSQKNSDIDAVSLSDQQQIKKLQAQRYGSDTRDRKWLAKWTAYVVSIWLFAVIIIVSCSKCLSLSDTVIITLLGTTTLNVLGLSFIVLRGHFNSDK